MAEPTKDKQPEGDTELKRHPDDVKLFNGIRAKLVAAGYSESQEIPDAITAMTDEIKTLRASNAEIPALKLKAADGDAYRKSLIDQVVKEGVRAFGKAVTGKDFDEEGCRKLLAGADLETIKAQAEQYRAAGDKMFPGGRQTQDATEEPTAVHHDVLREAYA